MRSAPGGFLGLGMSLFFVQGGVMAAETAFAADDAPSGCDDCGGSVTRAWMPAPAWPYAGAPLRG